jgi:hypothetical protein
MNDERVQKQWGKPAWGIGARRCGSRNCNAGCKSRCSGFGIARLTIEELRVERLETTEKHQ